MELESVRKERKERAVMDEEKVGYKWKRRKGRRNESPNYYYKSTAATAKLSPI